MEVELKQTERGLLLPVRVHPKARSNRINGAIGGRLKVAVTAPPEKGKANQAVRKVMARSLKLKAAQITIVSGETSRDKQVLIECADPRRIAKALDSIL